jgi:nucleoside-diphosphate-sugar epimerase
MAFLTPTNKSLWMLITVLVGVNFVQPFAVTSFNGKSHFLVKRGVDFSSRRRSLGSTTFRASAIVPGDTVVVIGGTGGVGQLVVSKLQSRNFVVRTTSRDKKRGEATVANAAVDVFEVDLLSQDTTALFKALDGANAVVISIGTTAFPTGKWKGGNTPKAIDEDAVKRIAEVARSVNSMKKMVLVTSVGVDRTGEMPFLILNLFGVLDAKKRGEEAIAGAAGAIGADYVIVRPGRLVGGPWTNIDISGLLKLEGGELCDDYV